MQRARLPESACRMSRHLPSSFAFLRSLAGHAPAVLCVLLLALLSASLASQTRSLRRELAELPAAAGPGAASQPFSGPRAALAGLFGGARRRAARRRASVCNCACWPASWRVARTASAALIAVAGRSQRFLPGAEVRPGTVLLAVHRDHVVAARPGL